MIILVHENNRPLKVLDASFNEVEFSVALSLVDTLFVLAKTFPEDIIMWCHQAYVEYINISEIPNIFHHNQIMASFSVSETTYIPKAIGFVDQSVFVNIKKDVSYPTWLMSSVVGGVSAEFLNAIDAVHKPNDFDYFINSLAKMAMPKGLFCYSEPRLLKEVPSETIQPKQASNFQLFKFVKQHYKWVWVFVLMFCQIIYNKKFRFFAFIRSLFYRKQEVDFSGLKVQSSKSVLKKREIDVIIPTIGRKQCLYDVLKDLAQQTLLPKSVIIVEQNPLKDSVSELDFLTEDHWPFKIKHVFTHQAGACNARNTALNLVESEWVFLNDDDIRFNSSLLNSIFHKIQQFGIRALSVTCLQKGEKLLRQYDCVHQLDIFGSGNSVVKKKDLDDLRFDTVLEFGYGEDFDFGVQLRNSGTDVVFFPDIKITHLKAPMGGFRTKFIHPWEKDKIQPKPSPTIMYTYLKHRTKEQVLGYKLILFFRLLKHQSIRRYINFYREFNQQWNASVRWAEGLAKKQSSLNV